MKLIKPSFKIIEQQFGESQKEILQNMYKHIERCGRTCYRSENKITEDSAKPFVDRMINSKHLAMLEHGTVYLKRQFRTDDISYKRWLSKYIMNKYIRHKSKLVKSDFVPLENQQIGEPMQGIMEVYITTNLRVIVENHWEDDLQYICEPTEFHEKRYTVKFISNIQFYKELTRHRKMSYAIESTRYCNYNSDKFNYEITFIKPNWLTDLPDQVDVFNDYSFKGSNAAFLSACADTEYRYTELIESGWSPQQAATILPQATKADIICTGFISDWEFIFRLRTSILHETGMPHPQMSELMDPLYLEFKERNYIK